MKRFTDTKIVRKKWFRKLSPGQKCAWRFLTDECDEAGTWSIDEDALEFYVGEEIDIDALIAAVNSDGQIRLERFGKGRLYLPGFCFFQYGILSNTCKPHLKAIKRLEALGLWEKYLASIPELNPDASDTLPDQNPISPRTLKDKEEEEEEDKETEEEEESARETKSAQPPKTSTPPQPKTPPHVAELLSVWIETLKACGYSRGIAPGEDLQILRALKLPGATFDMIRLALIGARHEPAHKGFDPKKHVSLRRIFSPDKSGNYRIADFANWATLAERPAGFEECSKEWLGLLSHFKMSRSNLLEQEVILLADTLRRYPQSAVLLALKGGRTEIKDDRFKPEQHVQLSRYLDPERIERFVNLGVKEHHKNSKPVTRSAAVQDHDEENPYA